MRTYTLGTSTLDDGSTSLDWLVEEGDIKVYVAADQVPEDEDGRKRVLDGFFDQIVAGHAAGIESGELRDPTATLN